MGRLSCKNMAMFGTCSISSARTVGSDKTHACITVNVWGLHLKLQTAMCSDIRQPVSVYEGKRDLPPSSDILATVSMTLMKSFSLSLNSRSTSSSPRATICLKCKRSVGLVNPPTTCESGQCSRGEVHCAHGHERLLRNQIVKHWKAGCEQLKVYAKNKSCSCALCFLWTGTKLGVVCQYSAYCVKLVQVCDEHSPWNAEIHFGDTSREDLDAVPIVSNKTQDEHLRKCHWAN